MTCRARARSLSSALLIPMKRNREWEVEGVLGAPEQDDPNAALPLDAYFKLVRPISPPLPYFCPNSLPITSIFPFYHFMTNLSSDYSPE